VGGFVRPAATERLPELESEARIDSIPAAMAQLDRASDHLKSCQAVQWTMPPNHPDLVPAEETRRMVEGLEETLRHLAGDYDQLDFRAWLTDAITAARQLEVAIRAGQVESATAHFRRLQQSCQTCHSKYRDPSR
jgi:hypothetical protein